MTVPPPEEQPHRLDPDGAAAPPAFGQGDSRSTRRDCLRLLATVSGGLAVGSCVVAAGVLPRHGDGSADPLQVATQLGPGETVTFNYPTAHDPAIGIRLANGAVVGYSSICTHLACAVLWRPDHGAAGELYCPCHEGTFDVRTGDVTGGPPPRGLPKVVLVEDQAGGIWAIGTARSGESEEHGLCRQLRERDPQLADQAGCNEAPGAPASASASASATAVAST
ncbi:Rieske (2Fe-2S) protein [Kitasatospora kifunensis]|uniref:Cytochrome bc1 complex Rieske iron-sulfur subunit n=1 Tax=Kitasatospora kifunensis TaxID=58351 RepID=A0A7W7R5I0_KITKI|nr:Rieske (2Fe-2S) protein [Kitasatospora kifunensis]MBB4925553.1 Rieske Fe-S protein [Kitasatospora kifunensis]